jgi:hypothetical protein
VRINPVEISIDDPSFYNEVYVASTTRRTTIDEAYRGGLAFDGRNIPMTRPSSQNATDLI